MIYSTSRCPSCNNVVKQQTNPAREIGVPFEKCPYCGAVYRNTYKEEWITKDSVGRFFFYLQVGVWSRAFLIPPLLYALPSLLFQGDLNVDTLKILWPLGSLLWLICGYFLHKRWEEKNILESLRRTSNPEYVKMLKDAGYNIYPLGKDPVPYIPNNNEVPNTEIKFCRKCGEKLLANSQYCIKCGEKIIERTTDL